MAYNFLACDRDQVFLLPPDLREWLPADHLAWFVLEVVDQLVWARSWPEGCANAFWQLAGTRGADRRAGHLDAPCLADPRRRRSARRVDLALQARAPGGGRWPLWCWT